MKFAVKASLILAIALMLIPTPALADRTHWGPDPDRSNPNGWMTYVVSRDGYTNISRTQLEIFSPSDNPSLRIYGKNLCSRDRGGVGREEFYQRSSGPRGGERAQGNLVTSYSIRSRSAASTSAPYVWREINRGAWDHRNSGCNDSYTNLIPLGYGRWMPELRMYKYEFRAQALATSSSGYYVNSFRILLDNTNGIISQDPNYDATSIGMQYGLNALVGNEGYIDHTVPFAPACNGRPERALIQVYDDDINDNSIQPNGRLDVRLVRQNKTNGNVDYPSVDFRTDRGSISASRVDNNFYSIRRTSGGSGATISASFNASPAYRYSFSIRNIWSNNTLQLYIPYSKVTYYVDCGDPSACPTGPCTPGPSGGNFLPRVVADPSTRTVYGNDIKFHFSVERRASGGDGPAVVTPEPRVWIDRGTLGDLDGADTILNNCFSRAPTPIATSGPGTYSAGFWAPNGSTPNCDGVAVPSMGAQVCGRMSIGNIVSTADPPLDPAPGFSAGPPVTQCIPLGKMPYFHGKNGNITAGGQIGETGCSQVSRIHGTNFTIASGARFGAYGDAGLKAIRGPIVSTGSMSSVTGTFLHFANQGNPLGNFDTTGDYCMTNGREFGVSLGLPLRSGNIANIGSDLTGKVHYRHNGDVRIANDITYAEAASPSAVPQMVMYVNGDLVIDAGVRRLDGIYIVTGDVFTCNEATGPSSTNLHINGPCNTPLTINGTMVVNGQVNAWRTYGAVDDGPQRYSSPAETFNLHPNSWVGEYERASTSTVLRTVQEREVPPRN